MNSVSLTAFTRGKTCAEPPQCVRLCARVQSSFAGTLYPWSADCLELVVSGCSAAVTSDLRTPGPRQLWSGALLRWSCRCTRAHSRRPAACAGAAPGCCLQRGQMSCGQLHRLRTQENALTAGRATAWLHVCALHRTVCRRQRALEHSRLALWWACTCTGTCCGVCTQSAALQGSLADPLQAWHI
jgi:hypothetical protein